MFRLNATVIIRAKVKEVWTNIAIYSHALLRIHVNGGQKLVRIAPPSLPPHHSSPATRNFKSSTSVEMLLRAYHLDVQGILHQQLLSSAMVQYSGFLSLSPWWWLEHSAKMSVSYFFEPKLVTDNLLSIYAAANWEVTERLSHQIGCSMLPTIKLQ